MRKLVSASLFTLILGGCSWIENVFRTDVEYIWNLDHEEVTVSSDIPGSVAVSGEKIPDELEWEVIPSGIVRGKSSADGKRYFLEYIKEGEGEVVASYGDQERRCRFISMRYSHTGLHLKVNGSDLYFPMIETYNDTREFDVHVDADTIRIEICGFIPESDFKSMTVLNISLVGSILPNSSPEYDGTLFTKFTEYDKGWFESDIWNWYLSSIYESPNLSHLKGMKMENYALVSEPSPDGEVVILTIESKGYKKEKYSNFRIVFRPLKSEH